MARQLEYAGNNVEKAAAIASKKLDIPRDKLKYQVLSYGSTGIFGLVGTKKAKIKVILPTSPPKPPAEEPVDDKAERAERKATKNSEDHPVSGLATPVEAPVAVTEVSEDAIRVGRELLDRVAMLIADDASITVDENSERLLYRVESSNAAVLIGKRGQTLEAMQYLVEKVVNRHSGKRLHVQVDVEGYLEKRQASLQSLAARMAEKASRTKKPVTIGQMSAYERRIVHLALKEDGRVRTQSKGDGYLRKLMIFPVRKSNGGNGKRNNNNRNQGPKDP